jgi:hypothetical protein
MGGKKEICPYNLGNLGGQKWERKVFIHMVAHESLLCHLKPNSCMLINGLYLLSPSGCMKKATTNVLKRIIHFLKYIWNLV